MRHYALVDTIFCCIFPELSWSTCIFVLERQDSSGAIIPLYHWATNELSPLHYYWTKVLGFQLHKQKDNSGLCVTVHVGQPCPFDTNSHINDRIKENNDMMWTCEFNLVIADFVSIFSNKHTLTEWLKIWIYLLHYASL